MPFVFLAQRARWQKLKRKNFMSQQQPTAAEMLVAGLHFGHRASRWHPKMKPYIFAEKKGIHIINLNKTEKILAEILDYIYKLIQEEKTILFVGTKVQVKNKMKSTAIASGMPYIINRWLGGTLTNFAVIKKCVKKLKDLTEQKQLGKLSKYTKKEQLEIVREMDDLERKVGGLINMNKIPDVIFVWDVKLEATAIREAKKMHLPIIAVCDTNSDPTGIDYIIPANDDATKGVELILGAIEKTVAEARKDKKIKQ